MILLKQMLLLVFFSFTCVENIHGIPGSSEIVVNNEATLQNSLKRWDQVVAQLTNELPLFDRGADRLRAYLFHAQKNYVEAFVAKTGYYPKNVDSISLHVIQLFYPSYQATIIKDPITDEINLRLQDSIDQRFKIEQRANHPITLQSNENAWLGKAPYHGLEIINWKPWFIKSASEYRLPPPPLVSESLFWQNQLHELKEEMAKASPSQKQRILFWANLTGIGSGDWFYIINQYMEENKVPLKTQLTVRDAIGKAIVDATIAAFDSKYVYLVKRPIMLDPYLKTPIETPNHPSFPSAHSTVSFAVIEVLKHYFPQNQSEWQRLAEEAGMSRIFGGIHFPIDHQAGKMLGKKVGEAVLKQSD